MVSIAAFQAVDPGSIPGRRILFVELPQQFGFTAGKSMTDAIFIARQLQEKYLQKKQKLCHIFVDLEKAFYKVPM